MGNNIAQDTLAGVTVAFIALPLALGFGVASGLGAITGMWGAIAGGFVGGLLWESNVGVSGPTGPKTVQLAVVTHDHMLANGQLCWELLLNNDSMRNQLMETQSIETGFKNVPMRECPFIFLY